MMIYFKYVYIYVKQRVILKKILRDKETRDLMSLFTFQLSTAAKACAIT